MSQPPAPPQAAARTDEAISATQQSNAASWPGLIERLASLHNGRYGMLVIDHLSSREEAQIDRCLAAGVDINAACVTDSSSLMPPLFLAISRGCPSLVNALLARGAGVSMLTPGAESKPPTRQSALAWSLIAASNDNPHARAITDALLETPATLSPEEINAPNHLLRTPLAICVQVRNTLARDVLIANGADASCRDVDGRTLLHLLASNQSDKVDSLEDETEWLHWVLAHGGSIDAVDATGQTPLDLARQFRPQDDGFVALVDSIMAERQARQLDHATQIPGSATARQRRI